jgi:NitT/TauT family transport system ATP-binding protein
LSDRIYVLTERPARIKAEIKVQLPRSRTGDVLTSPDFVALKRTLMELL